MQSWMSFLCDTETCHVGTSIPVELAKPLPPCSVTDKTVSQHWRACTITLVKLVQLSYPSHVTWQGHSWLEHYP